LPAAYCAHHVYQAMRSLPALVVAISFVTVALHFDAVPAPPALATSPALPAFDIRKNPVYVCPMDPDVRANTPGKCRRCGMALVAGIPDPAEFHLDLTSAPDPLQSGTTSTLTFVVHDPWKERPVSNFVLVHERLFHAFVVGPDLSFFNHGHPTFAGNGAFTYPVVFPTGGIYRVLGDFYPDGATPQLIAETVLVAGDSPPPPQLSRDYTTKSDQNLSVALSVLPEHVVAGGRTQMTFHVDPVAGFEQYLGAWGHMLAASDDRIDLMHMHPFRAEGGDVRFDVVFPRPRPYRVWVQFQRNGIVNTVHFDVAVAEAAE